MMPKFWVEKLVDEGGFHYSRMRGRGDLRIGVEREVLSSGTGRMSTCKRWNIGVWPSGHLPWTLGSSEAEYS